MLEPQFFFTHMIYFRRKPKQYLRLVVYVLKKIGVVQKRGKVALLFPRLNDDDYLSSAIVESASLATVIWYDEKKLEPTE
jgi:hypothetical protein